MIISICIHFPFQNCLSGTVQLFIMVFQPGSVQQYRKGLLNTFFSDQNINVCDVFNARINISLTEFRQYDVKVRVYHMNNNINECIHLDTRLRVTFKSPQVGTKHESININIKKIIFEYIFCLTFVVEMLI